MKKPVKDVAASARARLANFAKSENLRFQVLLLLYFQERLLARLAVSPHRDRFVLKGALLLFATANSEERWKARPTKDLDFLGRNIESSLDAMKAVFREVAEVNLEDGVVFDPKSVTSGPIRAQAKYGGVRVHLTARLGQARERLQVDVGFGEVITPRATKTMYPTLLGSEPLELMGYPLETVIAEKFEAMIKLETLNSRLKDFFDLWQLSGSKSFHGEDLQRAFRRTFERRKTDFNLETVVFTEDFRTDPARQNLWKGFLRRARIEIAPENFPEVMQAIQDFLGGIFHACCRENEFRGIWNPTKRLWEPSSRPR